jgi:hypothetical protein
MILMFGTFLLSKSQIPLGLEYQRNIEPIQLNSNKNLLLNNTSYLITKNNTLSFSVGKLNMYKGNYKPVSFNIGLSQDLFFPLNK